MVPSVLPSSPSSPDGEEDFQLNNTARLAWRAHPCGLVWRLLPAMSQPGTQSSPRGRQDRARTGWGRSWGAERKRGLGLDQRTPKGSPLWSQQATLGLKCFSITGPFMESFCPCSSSPQDTWQGDVTWGPQRFGIL